MVTVTVTAKFHNPSLSRRKEWQRATRLYRDTKQFCINGWENGNFDKSVTTASIDNDLYSAIQNQAIREAKSDHSKDGAVRYQESQPFAINNQNWELDTTESGTVVVGFPCVSQWWYTPIEVYDDIDDHVDRLVEGNAKKTRLQVYRRGDDWYCTFNIEYDTDTSGETPIGVDIGERHISPRRPTTKTSQCWCLVVRRSTFDANIVPYAIRYRKRVRFAHVTVWVTKNSVELTT